MSAPTISARVIHDVVLEAERGNLKHGPFNYPNGTRAGGMNLVLREQAQARCDRHAREGTVTALDIFDEEAREVACEEDQDALRVELLQAAAVLLKWATKLDREAGR